MNLWNQHNFLCLITPVINPLQHSFFLKFLVHHIRPGFSPCFQRFRSAPICRRNCIEFLVSSTIKNRLSVLIKKVFSPLLFSPCSIRIHWSDWTEYMNMRIISFLFVGIMNSHISDHSFINEILIDKSFCKNNVFFH